jgi:hypothetical protein
MAASGARFEIVRGPTFALPYLDFYERTWIVGIEAGTRPEVDKQVNLSDLS